MLHPLWFWFIQLRCSDKYPAGKYLSRLQRHQVLYGQCAAPRFKQTYRLAQADTIEGVAHRSGVGEMWLAHPRFQIAGKCIAGVGTEAIVLLLQHQLGDRRQFLGIVVWEIDVMGDP
jgi:hypothetical protein